MRDLPQSFYTVAWVSWLVLFVVIEALALRDTDKGDTLSEHVWFLMFHDGRPRPVIYYLFAGFFLWMLLHFAFRGRFG